MRAIWLLPALAAILAGCAGKPGDQLTPDTTPPEVTPTTQRLAGIHVPDFAVKPFQPFSRTDAVAIATREWRLFDRPVHDEPPGGPELQGDDKPERQPGYWQRVGEYWWIGQEADNNTSSWTGKHDTFGSVFAAEHDGDYAWSAAFISYVMRIAGATNRFPYSESHSRYINVAAKMARGTAKDWAVFAERPESYAPNLGDLICHGRERAHNLQFRDLPARAYASHCDIIVGKTANQLLVIGGNVGDAVSMKHIPIDADGRIAGPNGAAYDSRYPWMVVIRVLYDQ